MIQADATAILWLAANALVAVLGVLVLVASPSRGANRAFFALAALTAGTGTLTALAFTEGGTPRALAWTRTFWYYQPWLVAAILAFPLHAPTPSGMPRRRLALVHVALVGSALAVTLAYAVSPGLLIRAVTAGGVAGYAMTPLAHALVGAHALAVGALVLVLAARARASPHLLTRAQLTLVAAAVLGGLAPSFSVQAIQLATATASVRPPSWIAFAAGAAVTHAAALAAVAPWKRGVLNDPPRRTLALAWGASLALTVAFAALAPAAARVTSAFAAATTAAFFGVVAFALLRFDLFSVHARLRMRSASVAFMVSGGLAVGAAAVVTRTLADGLHGARYAAAALMLGLAFAWPVHQLTRGWTTRVLSSRPEAEERVHAHALRVYRAAVEDVIATGGSPERDAALVALRRRLDLGTHEHRVTVTAVAGTAAAARGRAPRGPLRPGDVLAGKYRVDRVLATGAQGRTLLATQVNVMRPVVVKEPHEGSPGQALRKEARLAARITHPNVVRILDVVTEHDRDRLVMEFVDGGSLADALKSGALPRERALRILVDLLAALDALHARGIVHRDVKPANVLLTSEGVAKLTDFGVADEALASETLALTMNGLAHPGTLHYMAPEQVRGKRSPGPAADAYATGAVLHEMLTATSYVDFPEDPARVTDAILYQTPRLDHPALHEEDVALLRALLAKAPADRPSVRAALAHAEAALARGTLRAENVKSP